MPPPTSRTCTPEGSIVSGKSTSKGCAAENIEEACDYLREQRNAKVGSIHINVIRPFPEAAVINALRGKKNVIIIERTDEAMAGDNPLGRDIRTALNKANQTHATGAGPVPALAPEETPRLFGGSYGLGSRDFRPEHTLGAYEFATGQTARRRPPDNGAQRAAIPSRRRMPASISADRAVSATSVPSAVNPRSWWARRS